MQFFTVSSSMSSKGLYCLLHGDQLPNPKINCISALSNTPFLAVPSPSEDTWRVNTRHNWQAKILPAQHLSKVYFSLAIFLFLYLKPLCKKTQLFLTIYYLWISRLQHKVFQIRKRSIIAISHSQIASNDSLGRLLVLLLKIT